MFPFVSTWFIEINSVEEAKYLGSMINNLEGIRVREIQTWRKNNRTKERSVIMFKYTLVGQTYQERCQKTYWKSFNRTCFQLWKWNINIEKKKPLKKKNFAIEVDYLEVRSLQSTNYSKWKKKSTLKLHPKLNFALETEVYNSMNFLDLTITKTDNSHTFIIYRKPIATITIIHNISNHPTQQKHAAFHSMVHRFLNIPLN